MERIVVAWVWVGSTGGLVTGIWEAHLAVTVNGAVSCLSAAPSGQQQAGRGKVKVTEPSKGSWWSLGGKLSMCRLQGPSVCSKPSLDQP